MNKTSVTVSFLLLANLGCASERLYVKVIDDDGCPVTNAVVNVGVPPKTAFWGSNGPRKKGTSYHALTDVNGESVVPFNCTGTHFRWTVKADGFYPSNLFEEWFKDFDEVAVPPAFTKVILHEHERRGTVTLYRKKEPQSMYAYTREMDVKSPIANGRYGFDLKLFDWLPPLGKGKVADFYYVRERPDETNMEVKVKWEKSSYFLFKNGEPGYPKLGEVVGRIEFDENCGAYVGKQTGCASFPTLYRADPNREYLQSFPIVIRGNGGGTVWLEESDVVNGEEYMIIRSRVKCDEKGNIVLANYSKILGTMRLVGGVGVEETVFNPRPNDTNLEFDPKRNLYQGKKGRGMIP